MQWDKRQRAHCHRRRARISIRASQRRDARGRAVHRQSHRPAAPAVADDPIQRNATGTARTHGDRLRRSRRRSRRRRAPKVINPPSPRRRDRRDQIPIRIPIKIRRTSRRTAHERTHRRNAASENVGRYAANESWNCGIFHRAG